MSIRDLICDTGVHFAGKFGGLEATPKRTFYHRTILGNMEAIGRGSFVTHHDMCSDIITTLLIGISGRALAEAGKKRVSIIMECNVNTLIPGII